MYDCPIRDTQSKMKYSIHIGECQASREPAVITTVLGPCVAVCLFDPVNRIGGMNHILMPGKADLQAYNNPARYGINAMELLINAMMKLGANRYQLIAKVFGGAHILSSISGEYGIGLKNVECIIDYLMIEKIGIANYNIGGYDSRRIFFHTDTGEVLLKRIKNRSPLKDSLINEIITNELEKKIYSQQSIYFFT